MLLMNVYRDSCIPITQFGGASMSGEFTNFQRQENWHCINAGQSGIVAQTGLPWGNLSPLCWRMPLKAGAISSTGSNILGSCSLSATGNYGMPLLAVIIGQGDISSAVANIGMAILAQITGQGDISSAEASLLAQISASLTSSGGISSANMQALLNALAELIGSGGISTANATGIGELLANIKGEGVSTATLAGIGELKAIITSYGSLTPEGIRDAIWSAVANNYNISGTMGQKLNNAASGGIDYDTLAKAVFEKITNTPITTYDQNTAAHYLTLIKFLLSKGAFIALK